ncbi:MFS transporter [Tatumella sp. JGM130]|uniref:MFS transporter n=1 Tax=Tatumella sp. JGM130 TaxID=2799797 RepID=UPI001BAF72C6|nr:MFS transporter [Tatumella sp. JGM130]MBS0892818.1 MFS transporter [Tatumella sp. JGM130]
MDNHAAERLSAQDYKTLILAALGGALEFYDFIIFVFFAAVIGELFFPADIPEWLRQLQTFGIFAAGYLARPLGGLVMAHFGDILGRKKMFSLSILLMAIPTLAMGLLPSYQSLGLAAPLLLLLMRLLQGAAIGGEVPGAWVFVAEHVPDNRTGIACGTLTAGLTVGILLGSLVAGAINRHMTPDEVAAVGWRVAFLLGGVFGFIALYLRRWLQETPVFRKMQQQKTLSEALPLKNVVNFHRKSLLISVLLTWLLSAAIVVIILMAPALMQKMYQIPAALSLQANSIATVMLLAGCMLAGWLVDRFGAGRCLSVGCLLLAASSWLFFHILASHPQYLIAAYALTGLCVGTVGIVPFIMVRAFPPAVRFSGISLSYNLSYAIFGGLTPVFVTLALRLTLLAPCWYITALCVTGAMIGGYLHLQARLPGQAAG